MTVIATAATTITTITTTTPTTTDDQKLGLYFNHSNFNETYNLGGQHVGACTTPF
jgi:hypothetical protein